MNNMKNGKASKLSGVTSEMLTFGGKLCFNSLTTIFDDILFKGKFTEKWILSSLVLIN